MDIEIPYIVLTCLLGLTSAATLAYGMAILMAGGRPGTPNPVSALIDGSIGIGGTAVAMFLVARGLDGITAFALGVAFLVQLPFTCTYTACAVRDLVGYLRSRKDEDGGIGGAEA